LFEAELPRAVLHVNTDDFFASLARLRDPALRRRPVVVGNLMSRGSVVSASYEAREAGVHPGLTMQQAERLMPGAALVQIDWPYARRAAREIFHVLDGYAPRVEPLGLDEAFVDCTGCERLLGPAPAAGARLRRELRDRLALDVSIGLASNKLVSRFASTAAKRHGLVDVLPGYEGSFLAPHPVTRLPGVSAALASRLRHRGVATVGELARFPVEVLEAVFGALGRRLGEAARGIDRSPVGRRAERLMLEESETFEPDLLAREALQGWCEVLCARLGAALRARRWCASRLTVWLEHSDRMRARRQETLRPPTHLDARLSLAARAALDLAYVRRVRVRRLGVEATGLAPNPVQLDLFVTDTEARRRRLAAAADAVRQRHPAPDVLLPARALLGRGDPRRVYSSEEVP
jgi:DNA polymerase-4